METISEKNCENISVSDTFLSGWNAPRGAQVQSTLSNPPVTHYQPNSLLTSVPWFDDPTGCVEPYCAGTDRCAKHFI